MRKLLRVLESVLPFIIVILIQASIYGLFHFTLQAITGVSDFPGDVEKTIQVISVAISGLFFYFWYQKISIFQPKVSLAKVLTTKNIFLLMLMGIGCQFFASGLMSILQPLFEKIFADYDKAVGSLFSGSIFMTVIYIVLVAPVVEELIFRGVTMIKLSRSLPFAAANIIQAALFGIFHMQLLQGIYGFAIGLLFGFVCHRFKTLTASILLHIFINASAFLMFLIPASYGIFVAMIVFGGGLLIISLKDIMKEQF